MSMLPTAPCMNSVSVITQKATTIVIKFGTYNGNDNVWVKLFKAMRQRTSSQRQKKFEVKSIKFGVEIWYAVFYFFFNFWRTF